MIVKTYQGEPCKNGHNGLRYKSCGKCVICTRVNAIEYNKAHKDKIRIKNKAYREEHKDKLGEYRKTYYENHKDELRTWSIAYRADHKEKLRAYDAAHNEAHKDEKRAYDSDYSKTPTGKAVAWNRQQKRIALKYSVSIRDFSKEQWAFMQEKFNHRCAYCGKRSKGKLTQDHITPLSKGGNHTLSNIVPACQSCNSKKNVNKPIVPVQPLLIAI